MKREIRLKLIKEYKDTLGEWVECEDEDGIRWILSRMAYETFKTVGLPPAPKETNLAIQSLLGGKNYASLPAKERHRILIATLEAFAKLPIENMLPKLGEINVG